MHEYVHLSGVISPIFVTLWTVMRNYVALNVTQIVALCQSVLFK